MRSERGMSPMPFEENSWHRRIEWKIDRLGHHLTRLHLTWPTSTPTTILPTSTAIGASMPMTDTVRTRWSWQAAKHVSEWVPRLLGWLAEKVLGWIAPWILPALAAAWAMGRDRLEAAWVWVTSYWHLWFG